MPRFVLLSKECLCKCKKYGSLSVNLHENHVHQVLKSSPIHNYTFKMIRNPHTLKLRSLFPFHQKEEEFIIESLLPVFQ